MVKFDGTQVAYAFLGASPGSQFSPIFRAHGDTGPAIATVNAGDNGLYVGGGTINLSFATQIGDGADDFTAAHQAALDAARKGTKVMPGPAAGGALALITTALSGADTGADPCPGETVFLDVFAENKWPKGNAANAAMLYVVPPYGGDAMYRADHPPAYADDAAFLEGVKRAAAACVTLLADYNLHQIAAHPALKLKRITVLRTCLFSGGQYRPASLRPEAVARAIHEGFGASLKAEAGGITLVEYEDAEGHFAKAIG